MSQFLARTSHPICPPQSYSRALPGLKPRLPALENCRRRRQKGRFPAAPPLRRSNLDPWASGRQGREVCKEIAAREDLSSN